MQKNHRLILLLAIIRLIIPYLLQYGTYEPHRDEFLYLAEGQHLAWGYLEVPPFLSLFARVTSLLGNSIYWIKWWPDVFGSLTFFLCARMALHLGGSRLSIWLVFFAFVFTGWLRLFFLFQPNAPEVLFATLMSYGLIRYSQTRESRYLYFWGIGIGLGLLSKYTIAFWAFSLLAGLMLTKERQVLRNKHFYLALLVSLLIFFPNLLWQVGHRFPFLHHMEELKESQLVHISAADFLKGEILFYLPVIFVWIGGLCYCFSKSGSKLLFFGISFLLLQLVMVLLHGKSYYTAGSFTILISIGAAFSENLLRRSVRVIRYFAIGFPVALGLCFWPLLLPVASPAKLVEWYKWMGLEKTGLLKWEDLESHPLPQDFADMLGWNEMAKKTEKAYATLTPSEKKDVIIWCDNYGEAGALNFYRKKYQLPEAYSENGSFLMWLPSVILPNQVILVSTDPDILEDPKVKQFASVTLIDSIVNPYAVERGTRILVLKYPGNDLKNLFQEGLIKKQKQFGIVR